MKLFVYETNTYYVKIVRWVATKKQPYIKHTKQRDINGILEWEKWYWSYIFEFFLQENLKEILFFWIREQKNTHPSPSNLQREQQRE